METIKIEHTESKKAIWTGRIISIICILFLLVDAIMKIIMHPIYVEGTNQAGWSTAAVQPLGYALLFCTLLYIIPRTSFYGALLLTAYFGGAVATMARLGQPFIFPIVFAMLVWTGLLLRNHKLKRMFLQQF